MKQVQIDDVVYVCAMYVVRAGDGWQVRIPGLPTRYFADGLHGGHEAAYLAAVEYRRSLAPITSQSRSLRTREQKSKLRPTGEPGVFLQVSVRRRVSGSLRKEYRLVVKVPGLPCRTRYLGVESNWEDRLEERLSEARQMRADMTRGLIAV